MFWNKYPYTDFHELNLDWILQKIKEMDKSLSEFEALNKITFAGEWDITKQYPAWTIVNTNGGTQGYISIKPVPAGVDITNVDYWASVVDYTATIADLQNRVIALESDVSRIDTDLAALTDYVAPMKKVLFIGDSYDGWVSGRSWIDETATTLDLEYSKLAQGGYGFDGVDAGNTGNYIDLVNGATFTDPDKYTDVVIVGGLNDNGCTQAQINTAIDGFISGVLAKLPNVKRFHIGYIGFIAGTDATFKGKVFDTIDYYKEYCNSHDNCKFIDNSQYIFSDLRNLGIYGTPGSNFHPTAAGITRLVKFLVTYFKQGHADYIENYFYNFDIGTDFTGTVQPGMCVSINNNLNVFRFTADVQLSNPASNWAAVTQKVGCTPASGTNSPYYGTNWNGVPVYAGANITSATPKLVDGRFSNGNLNLLTYNAITTSDTCIITPFSITCDFKQL